MTDKPREARLRRKAARHELILRRSRSRSPDADDYGKYRLVSLSTRGRDKPETGWLTLDQVEQELSR